MRVVVLGVLASACLTALFWGILSTGKSPTAPAQALPDAPDAADDLPRLDGATKPRTHRTTDRVPSGDAAPRGLAVPQEDASHAPAIFGPVEVRVLTPEGTPARDVRVRAWARRGGVETTLDTARTDALGGCKINLGEPEEIAPLDPAEAWKYVEATVSGFGPSEGELAPQGITTLRLTRGSLIRGRVLTQDGSPAVHVWVLARASASSAARASQTTEDGTYEIPCPEGRGWDLVHVEAPGLGAARARIGPMRAGEDVLVPDLVLRGPGVIEGLARYEDGSPAPGLLVAAEYDWPPYRGPAVPRVEPEGLTRSSTRTLQDGSFRLSGLARGPFHLGSEGTREKQLLTSDAKDVLVTVTLRRIRIRVVDEQGRPLPRAFTTVAPVHAREVYTAYHSPTGLREEAWFLPGERVHVSSALPGACPAWAEVVVPKENDGAEAVLVLRSDGGARGTVRFRIVDEDGRPCTMAHILPLSALTEPGLENVWDHEVLEGGSVVLPPLAPGTYDFQITPNCCQPERGEGTHLPMEVRAVVEASRECRLDLQARRGGRIRLTVHLAQGGDLPRWESLKISLVRDATGEVQTDVGWWTPLDGSATLGALPGRAGLSDKVLEAGRYVLTATAPGYRSTKGEILVRKGEIESLELTLDRE